MLITRPGTTARRPLYFSLAREEGPLTAKTGRRALTGVLTRFRRNEVKSGKQPRVRPPILHGLTSEGRLWKEEERDEEEKYARFKRHNARDVCHRTRDDYRLIRKSQTSHSDKGILSLICGSKVLWCNEPRFANTDGAAPRERIGLAACSLHNLATHF